LAALLVPVIYIAGGYLSGHTFKRTYELFFITNFGVDDELNVDMPAFGIHTGFVLVGVIGLVLGIMGLRRLTHRNAVLSQLLMFQSSWLLLSLVYYSGRSVTPTLVTGSAFVLGIVFALLFVTGEPQLRRLYRRGPRTWGMPEWILAGLIVLSLGLPFAAIANFPALQDTVVRLSTIPRPQAGSQNYLKPNPVKPLARVPKTDSLIGILSVSGNIWSEKLGVTNASVLVHPSYLLFAGGADLECLYLKQLPGNTLLTTSSEVSAMKASKICRAELDFSADRTIYVDRAVKKSPVSWVLVKRG
jgi:hypothetical protein